MKRLKQPGTFGPEHQHPKRRYGPSIGLKGRIIALAAITALLSGGLATALSLHNGRNVVQDEVLDGFRSDAGLAASLADRHVSQAQSALDALAMLDILQALLRAGDFEGVQKTLSAFASVQRSFDNVALVDLNGNTIVRAFEIGVAQNLADREWFQTSILAQAPYLGEPIYSRGSGNPIVVYSVPIRDENGSLAALLVAGISLGELSDYLLLANASQDRQITLVDRRSAGVILVDPSEENILQPFAAPEDVSAAVLQAGSIALNSPDYGEDGALVAVEPVGDLPWSVVVQKSRSSAFAPIGGMTRDSLLLAVPVILLAGLVSAWLAVQITDPLQRLKRAAQGLAAGNHSRRLNFTSQDEIGDLGRTFDRMAESLSLRTEDLESAITALRHEIQVRVETEAALEAARDDLEVRVAERTDELSRAVQSYREIFNTATDAIFVHETETGSIVDVNEEACQLLGRDREAILGATLETVFGPGTEGFASAAPSLIFQAVNEGPQTFEWQVQSRGDNSIWVEVNLRRGVIDGRPRVLSMARDVSQRKEAIDALRQSEEVQRLTVESVTDYAIFRLNLEGHIVSWNPVAEQIMGYSAEDILGQDSSIFVPPSGEPFLGTSAIEAATEGRWEADGWCVRGDGTCFWANTLIARALGPGGGLRGFVMVVRDRTVEHEAVEALERSERYFRGLIENSQDAIMLTNQEGVISYASASVQRVLGWAAEELIGASSYSVTYPDDVEVRRASRERTFAAPGLSDIASWRIRRKDGGIRWLEVVTTNLLDDPSVGKVVSNFRDITDRRELEQAVESTMEELRRSNADLEQFAYVASHDLQEPLRMVSSCTQLLARRYQGQLDAEADEFIGFAVEGASRMRQLIDDLLQYSRLNSRGNEFASVEMDAVLDWALFNLKTAIEESGAQMTHGPLPAIEGDQLQLSLLLQNLVSNAIKFKGEKQPRIDVSATLQQGHWCFCVKDNGIGIDPKFKERIFVIFQRLHHRAEYPGTGIGLAVCKRIVERHGGEMWVESTPGEGSAFYFTLPAAVAGSVDTREASAA